MSNGRTPRLAARIAALAPYSWRADPAVPPFPDARALIVFDGVCVLCSGFARFVVRHDRDGYFCFIMAQSPVGQALLRHYGLDPIDFETNLLIEDGRAHAKLEAIAGILRHLGWPWRLAANLMRLPPARMRDWLYDRVAQNRYAVFGRHEACVVPGPEWRGRMLD